MLHDWLQDFLAAGSAFTSGAFSLLVQYGLAACAIVLVIGVVLYFTKAQERTGKALLINAVVAIVLLCSAYMIVFGTSGFPDLSGIFVVPGTSP